MPDTTTGISGNLGKMQCVLKFANLNTTPAVEWPAAAVIVSTCTQNPRALFEFFDPFKLLFT
ncbi:MAG: hypothetical protein JWN70_242 [Planctomycetaceae bacterium]|nr:hypothetical protein [Planctomycetaceae bacterium]